MTTDWPDYNAARDCVYDLYDEVEDVHVEWTDKQADRIVDAALGDTVLYEPGFQNMDRTGNGETIDQLLKEVDEHIAWLFEVGGLVQVWPVEDPQQ